MRARTAERLTLLLAALTRAAALWSYERTGFARHPQVDAAKFWHEALSLAHGQPAFPDQFYQPPAYPLLLSLFIRVFGERLWVVHTAQALLGVLATALVIRAARALAPQAPRVAVVAGLCMALSPALILAEQDLLSPAWTVALVSGAFLLLARGRAWALSGLLLGLASALHPTHLLLGLVAVGFAASRTRRWLPPALLALGLAAPIAPTLAINLHDFGRPVPVSHNGGLNFYLGNNADWRDTLTLRPGVPFRGVMMQAEPWRRDVAQRDRYWWGRAWAEVTAHPGAWLGALATKALWSLNDVEIPRNEDYRCRTRAGPMAWLRWLPARYGLVFPLLFAGILAARRRWLVVAWLALHAPLVLFLPADRYRVATWPAVALLAGLGLDWLVRGRRWWWLAVTGLAFVPVDPRLHLHGSWCLQVEGNHLTDEGHLAAAIERYRRALQLDPGDLNARWWLARALDATGDKTGARAALGTLMEGAPGHYPGWLMLSDLRAASGDLEGAIEAARAGYALPPGRSGAGVRLVVLLARAGQRAEARRLVARDPSLAGIPEVRRLGL